MLHSVLPADLVRAYRETHYRVHGAVPFVLLVDSPSVELAAEHSRRKSNCSAFVTACNPHSEVTDTESNAHLHADLGAELRHLGLAHVEGIGQHPSNGWNGEPSYLVFGLALPEAEALGHAYRQNAIVWSGTDAVPRLILLR